VTEGYRMLSVDSGEFSYGTISVGDASYRKKEGDPLRRTGRSSVVNGRSSRGDLLGIVSDLELAASLRLPG
jgi:hypothetical protein